MKWFWLILIVVLGALAAPFLLPGEKKDTPAAIAVAMPWDIEFPGPGQARVFGLTLGAGKTAPASTLADAKRRFGNPAKVAIIAARNDKLSLEAYFDSVNVGTLTGRMVLTIDAADAELEAMRERAAKSEYMESGTPRFLLSEANLIRAEGLPLRGIVFIPGANLDAQTVLQRFGPNPERILQGDTLEHFLYPEKGLDVVVDTKGKEVLQYVAPRAFDKFIEPLRQGIVSQSIVDKKE